MRYSFQYFSYPISIKLWETTKLSSFSSKSIEIAFCRFSISSIFFHASVFFFKAYATYFLQLAGYNYLCKENGYRRIDKVAILVLNKDNIGYKFKIMDTDYLEEFYEPVFLLLLEVYKKWKDVLYWDWTEFI